MKVGSYTIPVRRKARGEKGEYQKWHSTQETVKKQGKGGWSCHLGKKGALTGKGWKLEKNYSNQEGLLLR